MARASLSFTLDVPAAGPPVSVRLRRVAGRWSAAVEGEPFVAVAVSAGEALRRALEPLGSEEAQLLLADLGLIGPSMGVLELERSQHVG